MFIREMPRDRLRLTDSVLFSDQGIQAGNEAGLGNPAFCQKRYITHRPDVTAIMGVSSYRALAL